MHTMEKERPAQVDVSSGLAGTFQAPARVNLIGEHTDYTGGYVLPIAISFTTTASIESSAAGTYRFTSENFETERTLAIDDRSARTGEWTDYPIGVLRQLQAQGIQFPPFHLHFKGNIPLGSGLSSSASIEVATAVALLSFAGKAIPAEDIPLLCRRAENDYVGSPCGIMDQFVVTAARARHALLLNTRDLTHELLPLDRGGIAGCSIVVANSMIKHSIATGEYGTRRKELEAGQTILLRHYPALRDLGDATLAQLATCHSTMTPESFRRCRHVISENSRVLSAKTAILAGNAQSLGDLITLAHASERDDFECSVEEVDFLVDTAIKLPGCYGARLTGGGFGGCTVNLVEASEADRFATAVKTAYKQRFGITAETYICESVDGAIARLSPSMEGAPC